MIALINKWMKLDLKEIKLGSARKMTLVVVLTLEDERSARFNMFKRPNQISLTLKTSGQYSAVFHSGINKTPVTFEFFHLLTILVISLIGGQIHKIFRTFCYDWRRTNQVWICMIRCFSCYFMSCFSLILWKVSWSTNKSSVWVVDCFGAVVRY